MPGRVSNFFRSSSSSVEDTTTSSSAQASSQRGPSRHRNKSPPRRKFSQKTYSYASSEDGDEEEELRPYRTGTPLRKMHNHEVEEARHQSHHRLSFPGLHFGTGKNASKDSQSLQTTSLDWKIESPPIIFHGEPETSTGALVSGQLILTVKEESVEVESFVADLNIHIWQKRPFMGHCSDCAHQRTEIKKWKFLTAPITLKKGQHQYPFSVLLEGHLPSSTDSPLVSISYEFKAEMTPKTGPPVKLMKYFDVKRSISVPEQPHRSIRVFPPTNITATVHYPSVIHPTGRNPLSMRIDGVVTQNPEVKTLETWKLKRLSWRLEETVKTIAPACDKHTPKDANSSAQPSRKGAVRTETRVLGTGEMTKGWKSDYSTMGGGTIEMELDFFAAASSSPSCNTKSRDGTEVSHSVVLELVVVQELSPTAQPKYITPTGVARILRMHFATTVTERAGLGVSWDNESPPIYQDVPPSPPSYPADPEPEYREIEHLDGERTSVDSPRPGHATTAT